MRTTTVPKLEAEEDEFDFKAQTGNIDIDKEQVAHKRTEQWRGPGK